MHSASFSFSSLTSREWENIKNIHKSNVTYILAVFASSSSLCDNHRNRFPCCSRTLDEPSSFSNLIDTKMYVAFHFLNLPPTPNHREVCFLVTFVHIDLFTTFCSSNIMLYIRMSSYSCLPVWFFEFVNQYEFSGNCLKELLCQFSFEGQDWRYSICAASFHAGCMIWSLYIPPRIAQETVIQTRLWFAIFQGLQYRLAIDKWVHWAG